MSLHSSKNNTRLNTHDQAQGSGIFSTGYLCVIFKRLANPALPYR